MPALATHAADINAPPLKDHCHGNIVPFPDEHPRIPYSCRKCREKYCGEYLTTWFCVPGCERDATTVTPVRVGLFEAAPCI
jgi:hypothetical protein